jgi:sec-independent protein translocase protein TatB
MPSFSDSIFLFILALLLFGPKKLPVLARELGKWVGEFRRASNEFKMQMEDELRQSEQADRMKQIEAMEAAAPVAPALPTETVEAPKEETTVGVSSDEPAAETAPATTTIPLPIATSGEVRIMPPSTGLPTPRSSHALGGLLDAIPPTETNGAHTDIGAEAVNHGD